MSSVRSIEAGLLLLLGTAFLSGCATADSNAVNREKSALVGLTPISEISPGIYGYFSDPTRIDFLTPEQRVELEKKFLDCLNPEFKQRYPFQFSTLGLADRDSRQIFFPNILKLFSRGLSTGVPNTNDGLTWYLSSNHDSHGQLSYVSLTALNRELINTGYIKDIKYVSSFSNDSDLTEVSRALFNLTSNSPLDWRILRRSSRGGYGNYSKIAVNIKLEDGRSGYLDFSDTQGLTLIVRD
jgi:hypothetical protein